MTLAAGTGETSDAEESEEYQGRIRNMTRVNTGLVRRITELKESNEDLREDYWAQVLQIRRLKELLCTERDNYSKLEGLKNAIWKDNMSNMKYINKLRTQQ